MDTLLDLPTVLARLDISRSTLRRWIAAGWFPAPIRLGPRVHRWAQADVDLWFSRLARGMLPAPTKAGRERR